MSKLIGMVVALALAIVVLSALNARAQTTTGCAASGAGYIVAPNDLTGAPADGHDSFGGAVLVQNDLSVFGRWQHDDHGTGNIALGVAQYLVCRHVDQPGPGQPGGKKGLTYNQAYFGGPAEWFNASTRVWESGYWIDVVVKDLGEPGTIGALADTYHFTIRQIADPVSVSGGIVYEVGRPGTAANGALIGGDVQIRQSKNASASTLPSWVPFEN